MFAGLAITIAIAICSKYEESRKSRTPTKKYIYKTHR